MSDPDNASKKYSEMEIIERNLSFQESALKHNEKTLKINIRTLYMASIINGLMAVSTFGLLIYTYFISSSTKDLRDASQKQVRAYVVVSDVSFENELTPDMLPKINIKNVGQTPAYEMVASRYAYFVENDPEKSNKYNVLKNRNDCSAQQTGLMSIGSTGSFAFYTPKMDPIKNEYIHKFDGKNIESFKDGKSLFFIQMYMCYRDVFKALHHMQFCRYYVNEFEINKSVFYPCPFNEDYED